MLFHIQRYMLFKTIKLTKLTAGDWFRGLHLGSTLDVPGLTDEYLLSKNKYPDNFNTIYHELVSI